MRACLGLLSPGNVEHALCIVKILVVEDVADLRALLVALLHDEGHEVDECGDGIEGLYRAMNWQYDAIVLDVMMPGLDGFSLLERLRRSKDTPVLMLTARDATRDRVRGLDGGADDYLTKPFDNNEFLARVRAVARRGGLCAGKKLRIGGVEIDTSAMTVEHEGKPVEFTSQEFRIVELLARRRGHVVSREVIFDQIFDDGNDEIDISNLLDVYIYKLRQKLGKDFIKTRRGFGYMIE